MIKHVPNFSHRGTGQSKPRQPTPPVITTGEGHVSAHRGGITFQYPGKVP